MCASCTGRAAAFFSASDAVLSQEGTNSKIKVQSQSEHSVDVRT
jgi:hypothetical protein